MILFLNYVVRFFLVVVGWDSFSIPTKAEVFELFRPFGEIESIRVEKTYGNVSDKIFLLFRSRFSPIRLLILICYELQLLLGFQM